jgi:hypothetical protein
MVVMIKQAGRLEQGADLRINDVDAQCPASES